jgi:hypothetical protein
MFKNSEMKDSFSTYKEAIKEKYRNEKLDRYANFLHLPTAAKLRDLGIILFKETKNQSDQKIFQSFFGFEFDLNGIQKIKNETDKFKPLATFLKDETELSDYNAADFLAVLLDYQPRPYSKFLQQGHIVIEKFSGEKEKIITEGIPEEIEDRIGVKGPSFFRKSKISVVAFGLAGLVLGSYVVKTEFFPAKNCMQWNQDHYDEVVCEGKKIGFVSINPIFEKDEKLLKFRKINVSDTTTFFLEEQPVVWYIKQNNKCEYFNAPGLHPISGKPLKPISNYIVEKYIMGKKK